MQLLTLQLEDELLLEGEETPQLVQTARFMNFVLSERSLPPDYSPTLNIPAFFSCMNFDSLQRRSLTLTNPQGPVSGPLSLRPFAIETFAFNWTLNPRKTEALFLSHASLESFFTSGAFFAFFRPYSPGDALRPIPNEQDFHQSGGKNSQNHTFLVISAVLAVCCVVFYVTRRKSNKRHSD